MRQRRRREGKTRRASNQFMQISSACHLLGTFGMRERSVCGMQYASPTGCWALRDIVETDTAAEP